MCINIILIEKEGVKRLSCHLSEKQVFFFSLIHFSLSSSIFHPFPPPFLFFFHSHSIGCGGEGGREVGNWTTSVSNNALSTLAVFVFS